VVGFDQKMFGFDFPRITEVSPDFGFLRRGFPAAVDVAFALLITGDMRRG